MDINTFGVETIDNIVATIPQLIIILTTAVTAVKNIGKAADKVNTIIADGDKTTTEKVEDSKNAILETFNEQNASFKEDVKELTESFLVKTTDTMEGMQTQLADFNTQYLGLKDQVSLIVAENRALIEIIPTIISEDPQAVRSGMATLISQYSGMNEEEVNKYIDSFQNNLPYFEEALGRVVSTVSGQTLDEMMAKIGFARIEEPSEEVVENTQEEVVEEPVVEEEGEANGEEQTT